MKEKVRRLQKDGEVTVETMEEVKSIVKTAMEYDKQWNIKDVNYGYVHIFKNSYTVKQINIGY